MIKPVSELLKVKFKQRGMGWSDTSDTEMADGTECWRAWQTTGESLARIATAVGGASVILQAAAEPQRTGPREPVRLPQPVSDYVSCKCQGGNKDCCFCDGRGSYRRR